MKCNEKILIINLILLFTCFKIFPQSFSAPRWSKKAVWYQIFPERFFNGDTTNDPKPTDLKGSWPFETPEGWGIMPWTADWYKLQNWEKADGHDFYWNAGLRRYGGDIQGIIKKLSYLKNLGVTAIYLNPVFESPSLHKYDATMYRHIDNNFGPNPERDRKIWQSENPVDESTWKWTSADSLFLKLINAAHSLGMKIIIDGVFNHVGKTFWAFRNVEKYQQKSEFKNWFIIKKFDDPNTPENEFDYSGWYGIKSLPEFREDKNGLVAPVARHIHNIVKRWMDPNGDGDPSDGIDGWRLDVADMVNHNFWKKFSTWVKRINPNAYLTGEIWWQDWSKNRMFNAAPWLKGNEFDAVMNYRFARAVKRFVADNKLKLTAKEFVDSLNNQYRDYGFQRVLFLMNLLDSHDTERLASIVVNPDHLYDHYANPQQNKNWLVRKPRGDEWLKIKLMIALQFTLPGAPMIYYGDEAGMWGGDDPDDRKPMVWPEFKYHPETALPFGGKRPPDTVKFNSDLFNWYKKLISIRRNNIEFSLGDIQFKFLRNNKYFLAYSRKYKNNIMWVLLNNNSSPLTVNLSDLNFLPGANSFKELISGRTVKRKQTLTLKAYRVVILK